MNETANYKLKKPETNEYISVDDLNSNMDILDRELGRLDHTVEVALPASGWSDTAPYKQRVAVPGIKATDEPGLLLNAPKTLSAADVKLRVKYTAMITDGESEDGYMTFWCGVKKPDVDFAVKLEGVSVNGEA